MEDERDLQTIKYYYEWIKQVACVVSNFLVKEEELNIIFIIFFFATIVNLPSELRMEDADDDVEVSTELGFENFPAGWVDCMLSSNSTLTTIPAPEDWWCCCCCCSSPKLGAGEAAPDAGEQLFKSWPKSKGCTADVAAVLHFHIFKSSKLA